MDRSVSVVIPCHNYGRYLDEAIASLDAQSRKPSEIIVCDDGSTDDSWTIAQDLLGDRSDVELYRHRQAWGVTRTLNELIDKCSGEIVIPFSSDDRLGPRYVELLHAAIADKGFDYAYTDLKCFGAETTYIRAPECEPDRLARANFISGSAAFRRGVFESVGGYSSAFESLGFEDYDFWITAVEAGMQGTRVEGTYLEWRRHPGGSRNSATLIDRIALRLLLVRRHPRFFLHPRTLRAWIGPMLPAGRSG